MPTKPVPPVTKTNTSRFGFSMFDHFIRCRTLLFCDALKLMRANSSSALAYLRIAESQCLAPKNRSGTEKPVKVFEVCLQQRLPICRLDSSAPSDTPTASYQESR